MMRRYKKIMLFISVLAGLFLAYDWLILRADLVIEINPGRPDKYFSILATDYKGTDGGASGSYRERFFIDSDADMHILHMWTIAHWDGVGVFISHPKYASGGGAVYLRRMSGNRIKVELVNHTFSNCTNSDNEVCSFVSLDSHVIQNGGVAKIVYRMPRIESYLDSKIKNVTNENFIEKLAYYHTQNSNEAYDKSMSELSEREVRAIKLGNIAPHRHWDLYFFEAKTMLDIDLIKRYSTFLSEYCKKYEAVDIRECEEGFVVKYYYDELELKLKRRQAARGLRK